ncbi:ww domain-containing protein [Fusarium heterosporum]|uniref:Ww domain-containing protein n=1 Tax=Fusarium heterosporum TaxID=42747 RepID=A0A8H5T8G4_FUSHE|nr:ww domain-containing protein [Fusarium heterosporum]
MSAQLQHNAAWEAGPLAFFSRQFIEGVPRTPKGTSLAGQTALITGSNVGLGFECARQLLALNLSHLIIAVRNQTKGDAAARKLRQEFPSAKIEVSLVDMASYKSIQNFAKWCETLPRLDIAILNAGLNRPQFERSEESKHEMTTHINYISTALLSILLLPVLKAKRGTSAPAHLAIVGSDTSYWAQWKETGDSIWDVIDNPSEFNSNGAYSLSKLLLIMFVDELSRHMDPEEVIVNLPNPGACSGTDFGSDGHSSKMELFWMMILKPLVGRYVSTGARSYVDAVAVKGKESHGSFIGEGTIKPFPQIMYEPAGKELQETAWKDLMSELSFAKPLDILKKSN